jgi:hypothetical protein
MNLGDIISLCIGGSFGLILLCSFSVYILARTVIFCMPFFREVCQEYTKWRLELAKADAEFLEVYNIYNRMHNLQEDYDA